MKNIEKKWRDVWINSKEGSKERVMAKEKLTELGYFAKREAKKDQDHAKAEALAKTANSEKKWHEVWAKSKDDSELVEHARKMEEQFIKARREARKNKNHAKAEKLIKKLIQLEK